MKRILSLFLVLCLFLPAFTMTLDELNHPSLPR